MSTDLIEIQGLTLRMILGVDEWERKDHQDVLVHLAMWTDIRAAAVSDSIDDAVNYRSVAKRVIAFGEASSFHLVEALATEIANLVLTEFGVSKVRVTVEKPGALRFARSVSLTIERER